MRERERQTRQASDAERDSIQLQRRARHTSRRRVVSCRCRLLAHRCTRVLAAVAKSSSCFTSSPGLDRSEEHTSELQSLMRISYAVFCLKKKKTKTVYQLLTSHMSMHK